jgi:hypothetical protein
MISYYEFNFKHYILALRQSGHHRSYGGELKSWEAAVERLGLTFTAKAPMNLPAMPYDATSKPVDRRFTPAVIGILNKWWCSHPE